MDEIRDFLIEAKKNTYANTKAEQKASSRVGSNDYEYKDDKMTYHDTYFGGTRFIGEEVVYMNGSNKPVWGMNYYGVILDSELSEETMDQVLRPALMSVGQDNTIPVRGPKSFENGEYSYTFKVNGDLTNFSGLEQIYKGDKKIYELSCCGGKIM